MTPLTSRTPLGQIVSMVFAIGLLLGTVAGLRAARPARHVQSQGDQPVADLRGNIQRPESKARQSDLV